MKTRKYRVPLAAVLAEADQVSKRQSKYTPAQKKKLRDDFNKAAGK